MRKRILCFMTAVLIGLTGASVVVPDTMLIVEAHQGRTDASGGYKDNKNASSLESLRRLFGTSASHSYVSENDQTAPTVQQETGVAAQSVIQLAAQSSVQQSFDSAIFNAAFYTMENPDIAQVTGTDSAALYQHFITSGMLC